jgi:DNA polymerase III delta prime subunit
MFEIKKAERKGACVTISLAGESGSGKTYSALRLARGLVGPNGKIGVIDTEQKRASLYADCFGGFDVIDLEPPFSPERYAEAIETFKKAGYNAVVIDSMSHEWESEGGILDTVDQINKKYIEKTGNTHGLGLGAWKEPKARHRALMNKIVNSGMHLIICYRVKYEMVEQIVNGKKTMVKSTEPSIVQEPNSLYDITCEVILKNKKVEKLRKSPEGIEFCFKPDHQLTEQDGADVIEWLSSKQRDKDAIIEEGKKQKDKATWFKGLNKFENYLARKYASEIKSEPVVEQTSKFENVEL